MLFYSLSVYALTSAWMNLKTYIVEHHIYVFGYIVLVGLVSFAVTYRMVKIAPNVCQVDKSKMKRRDQVRIPSKTNVISA